MQSLTIACANLIPALKGLALAAVVHVVGECPKTLEVRTVPAGTVLDFSKTTASRLDLNAVSGITVTGFSSVDAKYQALNVFNSHGITLVAPHCLRPGTTCVSISKSDHVDVDRAWTDGSLGDGVDIAGSSDVRVHDGKCEHNTLTPIHPDCVQLWSLPGLPVMHITVENMTATGDTQGFDLWDHQDFGATDIKFIHNHGLLSAGNCVGVLNAHALVVKGNTCRTMKGAPSRSHVNVRLSPDADVRDNDDGF